MAEIISVANAAELYAALSSAQGGDRIELAPGNYGDVDIGGNFTSDVTIVSADPANPAVFTGMDLVGTHIVLDRISFEYSDSPGANREFSPFDIDNSSFITVRNSVFTGARIIDGEYGSGAGLVVRNSDHIVIEYNEFSYWSRALRIFSVTDVVIRGNDLHSNSNDAINLSRVDGVLIEGNWIHDFLTAPGQLHNDMIQMWTLLGDPVSQNITIRDNFLDAGTENGGVQAIFIMNEAIDRLGGSFEEYAYRNILIEDNVIYGAHVHGITVGHTDGLVIRNNTLLYDDYTTSGPNWTPEIRTPNGEPISSQSINVTIEDNIAGPSSDGNNFVVQYTDPNGANYYGDLFVNALGEEAPSLADLRALPGGVIETEGLGAEMTRSDITLEVGPAAMVSR
jgi:hypothetical protein